MTPLAEGLRCTGDPQPSGAIYVETRRGARIEGNFEYLDYVPLEQDVVVDAGDLLDIGNTF